MPADAVLANGGLENHRHEVERLLGRCMLRLQQYERLLKSIAANYEISGPAQELESIRAARIAGTASNTLGTLINQLLGSYVVTEGDDYSDDTLADAPRGAVSFSMQSRLCLSAEEYSRTKSDLKDLVALRNNLVHCFIDRHELGTLDGCRSAHAALFAAYTRIDKCFEQLSEWAEVRDQAALQTADFMRSEAYRDLLINGIAPDGPVDWEAAGIVRVLHEALNALAVEGWAPLATAMHWIAERYPDQHPAKYGCASWPQVLHESRLFELRYRDVGGQRTAWYKAAARDRAALTLRYKTR